MKEITPPHYPSSWYVPKGTYWVGFEKRKPYLLVIPVINEGERILKQLKEMYELGISQKVDLLIADGGSTDGSLETSQLSNLGVRALSIKKDVGKLSAQLQMAYAFGLEEGYEGIITIDGNGKDGVEAIPNFVKKLEEGFDLVHGSRFVKGGRAVRTPRLRHAAIRLVHAPLISLSAKRWLTDTTNGFRGYSKNYLLHPEVQPFRKVFQSYELLAYLSARASQLGLRVCQVPVSRIYPLNEPTPTKIKGWKGYQSLLETLFKQVRGHYAPQ